MAETLDGFVCFVFSRQFMHVSGIVYYEITTVTLYSLKRLAIGLSIRAR